MSTTGARLHSRVDPTSCPCCSACSRPRHTACLVKVLVSVAAKLISRVPVSATCIKSYCNARVAISHPCPACPARTPALCVSVGQGQAALVQTDPTLARDGWAVTHSAPCLIWDCGGSGIQSLRWSRAGRGRRCGGADAAEDMPRLQTLHTPTTLYSILLCTQPPPPTGAIPPPPLHRIHSSHRSSCCNRGGSSTLVARRSMRQPCPIPIIIASILHPSRPRQLGECAGGESGGVVGCV